MKIKASPKTKCIQAPSDLSNLDFWVEPQALAALLVANNHIAASDCGSIQPHFLIWTKH